MKHDIALLGHAFALRPAAESDAAFIVALRADNGAFLNRGATSESGQRTWFARYFAMRDDFYFVVERNSDRRPEGTAGIYGVDRAARTAEWGRFVVRNGSSAAVEAAWLVYRCAFEVLGLDALRCRTLAGNAHVVAFHDSCGLVRTTGTVTIDANGIGQEAVEHVLQRDRWPAVAARLDALAARLARSLRPSTESR